MNFELNEEQAALQDSVRRMLRQSYGFEQRRALAASETGWSEPAWRALAELGTTGLLVPDSAGGFGGRCEDVLPVAQALGGALSLEPYLACAVLAATALRHADASAARDAALRAIAQGTHVLAWAHDEPGAHHAPVWVETRARRQGDAWVLDGLKCNVAHGGHAAQLVVTARLSGDAGDDAGRGLFLVDGNAHGLARTPYRLVDDSPAADITFEATPALPLCVDPAAAAQAIEATIAAGMACICADAVGAMEAAFQLAVDYVQTRRQFGRAIGENQAVRHRLAEMLVSLETCRSMAIAAALAADDPGSPGSRVDLMRAKLIVGKHARAVCHGAIQLHGGIGMTEEYAVGHYLRRVTLLDQCFGDADAQAHRLAAMMVEAA